MRWRAAALGLALVALAPTACAGGDSTSAPATTVSPAAGELPPFDPAQTLPPNDVGSLRRIYDPALAVLGLRLTRGALVDVTNNSYTPSNNGTHLALYVEPTGDYTDAQYLASLWDLSALITPDVFGRWSGIESYDICQEPPPSVDDSAEPFPVTQINISRDAASLIDWQGGSLPDLLRVGTERRDLQIVVGRQIRQMPEYLAAAAAARAGSTASTDTTTGGFG